MSRQCTRRFATACPKSLALRVGVGNLSISTGARPLVSNQDFACGAHANHVARPPLARQLHPSSHMSGFSVEQVLLRKFTACHFALRISPLFTDTACILRAQVRLLCSGCL